MLDFEQLFQNNYNITVGMLYGWGGGRGWVSGGSGWEAGGGLDSPLGLFGLAMTPLIASHRPKHA